jgi:hypothetical protein
VTNVLFVADSFFVAFSLYFIRRFVLGIWNALRTGTIDAGTIGSIPRTRLTSIENPTEWRLLLMTWGGATLFLTMVFCVGAMGLFHFFLGK